MKNVDSLPHKDDVLAGRTIYLNNTMQTIHLALKYGTNVLPRSIVVTVSALNLRNEAVEPELGSLSWSDVLKSWYFYAPESHDGEAYMGVTVMYTQAVKSLILEAVHWPTNEPLKQGIVQEIILGCDRFTEESATETVSFRVYRLGGE